MSLNPILLTHIAGGMVGIVTGMVAIFLRKGSALHGKVGNAFFYSMLVMSSSATYLAYFEPSPVSVVTGLLTFYLVVSGRATAKNTRGDNTYMEYGAFAFIIAVVVIGVLYSWNVISTKAEVGETLNGLDYFLFVHTGFAAFCALLDFGLIISGGIYGSRRVARHLGRMTFALYIATASFFLGQQQFFPEYLRGTLVLASPVLLVVFLFLFWLIKTCFIKPRQSKPKYEAA